MSAQGEDRVQELRGRIEAALSSGAGDGTERRSIDELIEQVNIYYRELEFQNDELVRVGKDLETVKLRYQDLFMNAPVGYVLYDDGYRILSINRQFMALIGVPSAEAMEGGSFDTFVAPESQDAFYFHVRALLKGGVAQKCRLLLSRRGGGESATVLMESNLLFEGGKRIIRSAVVDISQEETLAKELAGTREELESQNLVLRDYHDRLEATMLAGNLAWWQMDVETGAVIFNEQKTRMLGFPPDSFRHYTDFTRLVHPEDYDGTMRAMVDYLEGRADAYRCEYRIRTAGGDYKWFQDTGVAGARNDQGRPTSLVGVVVDVTELKSAQLAAEQANKAKSEFLANMSHEIRTPLNAVIGFTDLLRDAGLSTLQREYLENAGEAARTLLDIINDILDFSKIEAGRLDLDEVDCELPVLLEQVMKMLRGWAAKKGLEFTLAMTDGMPRFYRLDPVRLKQILVNLLGNGIKFCDRGSVALSVSHAPDPADSACGLLRFEVRDTGIGIGEEQRRRLFRAFAQADASITRRFGGTGLGLVISNMLVEKMGGRLEMESELGKGSRFFFTLRAALSGEGKDAPPVSGSAESIPYASAGDGEKDKLMHPHRILIAEDVKMNALLMESLVRRVLPRSELLYAEDGVRAVELYAEREPDLVLMDVQMPGMDGLSATRRIRELEAASGGGRRVPIVAVSAGAMEEEREEGRRAGVDDYVVKPIDALKLKSALFRALGIGSDPAAPNPDPGTQVGAVHFDRKSFLDRVGGDGEMFAQMVELGIGQFQEYGRTLRAAADSGDAAAVKATAHKFKGSAATLSCFRLKELLAALESAAAEGGDREGGTAAGEAELETVVRELRREF